MNIEILRLIPQGRVRNKVQELSGSGRELLMIRISQTNTCVDVRNYIDQGDLRVN